MTQRELIHEVLQFLGKIYDIEAGRNFLTIHLVNGQEITWNHVGDIEMQINRYKPDREMRSDMDNIPLKSK